MASTVRKQRSLAVESSAPEDVSIKLDALLAETGNGKTAKDIGSLLYKGESCILKRTKKKHHSSIRHAVRAATKESYYRSREAL